MTTARKAALTILDKVLNGGAYSNIVTGEILGGSGLDERDCALASAIAFTSLERKITIDYNLSLYLPKPLRKLNPKVYLILLSGAAQILYMDKIPDSAAVNESVRLASAAGVKFASGLINAVLRKVAAAGAVLPEGDRSVAYSFPPETAEYLVAALGEEKADYFMKETLVPRKPVARVNTIKNPSAETESFEFSGNPTNIDGFAEGLFFVQDRGSQLCVRALAPKPGDTVLDACSAPGGKSFSAACLMNNTGKIFSCDIHGHKLRLIEQGAERLGIGIIETRLADGTDKNNDFPLCDRVLCDVPCSGLGETGKKPEIRYKDINGFSELPAIQYAILSNCSRFVKKGGTLVYSTCTVRPEENGNVTERFLGENPDFEPYPCGLPEFGGSHETTLLSPEGFYICRMRRKENGGA